MPAAQFAESWVPFGGLKSPRFPIGDFQNFGPLGAMMIGSALRCSR